MSGATEPATACARRCCLLGVLATAAALTVSACNAKPAAEPTPAAREVAIDQCQVQLFAHANFSGTSIYLRSGGEYPDLAHLPDTDTDADWEGQVQSLKTGPKTQVELWNQPDFAGPSAKVGPHAQRRWAPRSMKVSCMR